MDMTGPKGQKTALALCFWAGPFIVGGVSSSASPPPDRKWRAIAGLVLLAVLIALAFAFGLEVMRNVVASLQTINPVSPMSAMLWLALVLYALLIAVPFMPGIEVGVALLLLRGAQIAPFVYLATVCGLMLAFVIGQRIPLRVIARGLKRLGLRRAAKWTLDLCDTAPEARLARQRDALPDWLAHLTIDYRYLSLALLLNIPGTFAIGGGGGIMLVVGLSRLFRGWVVLLTVMIATLPVPLTVWIMGSHVLRSW